MARYSYKAGFRAVYDLQGNIVDYAPILIPGEKYSEIRAELLGQAQSHLESLSANENKISELTLKLTFTSQESNNALIRKIAQLLFRKYNSKQKSQA